MVPNNQALLASVPTYPSGLWSFTIGSKKYDPEVVSFQDRSNSKFIRPRCIKQHLLFLPLSGR
jgi:spermidine synthase